MGTKLNKPRKSARIETKAASKKVKTAAGLRTSKQARAIIELLLEEMREGMTDPSRAMSEEWERLFGSKQSVVANLQKLVQALAVLPDGEGVEEDAQAPLPPMSSEEVGILKEWLEQGR